MPVYWINGKRVHSDRDLSPEELESLSGPQLKPTPEKSFLSKTWDTLSTPLTDAPTRAANKFNETFMGQSDLGLQAANDLVPGLGTGLSMLGGFGRGVVEGIGNVATQFTSPIDLASLALGAGEFGAIKAATSGLRSAEAAASAAKTAQNLGRARQITSAPVAAHGAVNLLHGESTPMERLMAVPELAGGLAGIRQPTFGGNINYRVPPPDFSMGDMGNTVPPPSGPMLPPAPQPLLPPRNLGALPDAVMNADIIPPNMGGPMPDLPIRQPNLPIMEGQVIRPPSAEAQAFSLPYQGQGPELLPPIGNNLPFESPINVGQVLDPRVSGIMPEQAVPPILEPPPIGGEIGPYINNPPIQIPPQFRNMIPEIPIQDRTLTQNLDTQEINNAMSELAQRRANQQTDITEPIIPKQRGEAQLQQDFSDVTDPFGKPLDDKISGMSISDDGTIKLDVGDPEDVIPIMAQTYAGHTVSVAGKELIQNALDAVKHLGGKGKLSVSIDPSARTLTVTDSGPGLTKEELATIYTDLSRSGKRGKGDFIGEMGFGKMAYLATGENVRITTISLDPKTRQLKQYVLEGSPQQLIKGAKPVESVAPVGSTTGTKVEYFPQKDEQFESLSRYLDNLNKYSNIHTPIDVELKSENPKYPSIYPDRKFQISSGQLNPKEVIGMGESEGTRYALSIPESAMELQKGANQIALILVNRGMFQGVDTYNVPFGIEGLPDRIVVNLDPKVDAKSNKYPLTVPTREKMTWRAKYDIENFINEKIVGKKVKNRDAEIQRIYDNMPPSSSGNFVTYDTGGKFTPEEMQMIHNSQALFGVSTEMNKVINHLNNIFKAQMLGEVEKIGYVFDETLRGVNIQNPSNHKKMAILINPAAFFKHADPMNAANGILHTTIHEFGHTMQRPEDKVTGAIGDAYEAFGIHRQIEHLNKIVEAISEVKNGRRIYRAEVQKILSRYNESRGREATSADLLIRKGIGLTDDAERSGRLSFSRESTREGTPPRREQTATEMIKEHPVKELWNLPRGMMSVDLPFATSAGLRQGLPWVFSRHWWRAWEKQANAFGSEQAYKNQILQWETKPLYRPQVRFRGQGNQPIFEPSIAEQMGLVTSDLTDMTRREEVLKGQLAEKLPGYGKWIRGSNRAYTAFLNHIRFSAFEQLVTAMDAWDGRNITNVPLAKEVANFVNTTTGRGSGKFQFGISKDKSVTLDIEQVMGPMGEVFFSPRLWKSRLDMLNPSTYMMADKRMRMQWIKAFLSVAGAWWGIASLAEMMLGAEVSKDPTSSDYGKIRIGDTRIDPGGGFQQNLVIANRVFNPLERGGSSIPETGITPIDLATGPLRFGGGGITSPVSKRFQPYGQEFRGETRMSDMLRFTANKLHPSGKYIYDYFNRNRRQPFYTGDRTAQLFIPMFAGDLAETITKDPILAGISLAASSTGMGAQTFEGGPGKPVFTPLMGLEGYDKIQY